ncbi:MAG: hypothetical protein JSU05_10005 [Bacteroidetes bacterium]|nr:hypothetical protein [Bacteroidota bacterium]
MDEPKVTLDFILFIEGILVSVFGLGLKFLHDRHSDFFIKIGLVSLALSAILWFAIFLFRKAFPGDTSEA